MEQEKFTFSVSKRLGVRLIVIAAVIGSFVAGWELRKWQYPYVSQSVIERSYYETIGGVYNCDTPDRAGVRIGPPKTSMDLFCDAEAVFWRNVYLEFQK